MRPAGERPTADRIRNVVLVGHRGSGKTALHEALLFEAGATTRLGSVPDASTVSDADPDEQARQMSISAALSSFEWQDRKINLVDTPGDPSFVADALGALRVCESAVFVINAVMGVEVTATRLWARAAELDMSVEEFQDSLTRISNSSVIALDELWTLSDSSGDQVSLLDTIQDPDAVDPAHAMDATETKDRLADAIARLPEREKLVVALYYYENLTLREIGEVLGVTESRVSQLHTKAVLRLKSALQADVLE